MLLSRLELGSTSAKVFNQGNISPIEEIINRKDSLDEPLPGHPKEAIDSAVGNSKQIPGFAGHQGFQGAFSSRLASYIKCNFQVRHDASLLFYLYYLIYASFSIGSTKFYDNQKPLCIISFSLSCF